MEMIFCPLYSGSSGNCLFVQYGATRLLIDAGKSGKMIDEALDMIGVDGNTIDAILITHEHIDHISGAGVLCRKHKIPVYATEMTWNAMDAKVGKIPPELRRTFDTFSDFYIGDVGVVPFSIPHDAADPVGYRLWGGGLSIATATDLGHFPRSVRDAVAGSSLVLLESNHDPDMLRHNDHYNERLKQRILGNRGHLSNAACADALLQIVESGTKNVILGHLSGENNTPSLAYHISEDRMTREAVKLLLERLLALMLPHDLHQNTRLLLSMAQEALLIGLPALLMRRGRSARTGTMRLSIGLLLCAAVLGLAMRALATPLTQLWGNFVSAPERQIAAADSAGEWCLQLLALAVLPAALEEALFRGVVLQTLLDSGSRFGAWLLTTLFFSLLHGNLAALPAHLLFGGALTLAEMRTGNLLVPMVMHAVYNASALFWRGMSAGWLIFCGAAVLALGIWALMTLPRTAKMRMKRGHIMLSAAILLLMAVQYLL